MMKLTVYLNLLCLVILSTAVNVKIFTKDILDQFKHFPDYTHHFVFFHRPTLDAIQPHLTVWDNQHGTPLLIKTSTSTSTTAKATNCQNAIPQKPVPSSSSITESSSNTTATPITYNVVAPLI